MQLLRMVDVCQRIGLKRSSVYRLLGAGKFPQPVQVGERARAWPATEIDSWIQARINERDMAAK